MGVAVIVGSVIAGGTDALRYNLAAVTLGFLTGFSLTGASMILNDFFDIEIDRINVPSRPLPSGRVTPGAALRAFYVFTFFGLLCSALISKLGFMIALSSWALSTLYNWKLKGTGIWGNVIVSYNVMVPILYGSAIVNRLSYKISVFSLMIFLSCLAREVVKGIADVEGDRERGVKTVAVTRGERAAAVLASLFLLAAISLSPVPYVMKMSSFYYLLAVLPADALFTYSMALILKEQSKDTAIRAKKVMLLAMAVGLLAFLVSGI